MARLTPEQWEMARIDFEVHQKTFVEIAEKYGCNVSSVSRKAKQWNQAQTQTLIDATIENQKEKIKLDRQTQTLNANLRLAVNHEIFDRLAFELQNNSDMQEIRDKAMLMLQAIERPSELKSIMDIIRAHREAHLGKSSDTQINIQNNNTPERIERIIIDPKA